MEGNSWGGIETISQAVAFGAAMTAMFMLSACIPIVVALAHNGEARQKVALWVGLTLILPVTVAVYLGYCIATTARQAPYLIRKATGQE